MTLEKAILFAIEKEGIEIIGETRFINYLNDLQAFEMPAVKRIVGTMVSGGYSEKLKHSLTTQNYELEINDAKSKLVNIEGFQADLVEYVLNCLLYATKKTTQAPIIPSSSDSPSSERLTSSASLSSTIEGFKPQVRKLFTTPITNPLDPTGEHIHYRFPSLDLLSPHSKSEELYEFLPLRDAITYKAFQESKNQLPICLGVTENKEAVVVDLAEQPHLLIAGSTGTGKSVFLHSIISSLLYKRGPSEVKFVLIDPHRVELSPYADIEKYFLAKSEFATNTILSEFDEVTTTLQSIVQEIEQRYKMLVKAAVRGIEDYNRKWRIELRNERDEQGKRIFQYMPHIVIIIDEFSSYAQYISNFQSLISQIAGKGRAAGVHLVLSTNGVGARLLTPAIKALFPARIAFDVPQAHESILILDCGGAEKINHKGRLIFKNGDTKVCVQSPFVDSTETSSICKHIKTQEDADTSHNCYVLGQPVYEPRKKTLPKDRDPLFEECARWIVQADTASTSTLQRKYLIGYNRAGRIMDQLEDAGIVGPAMGGKPRKVLLSPMDVDALFPNSHPVASPTAKPVAKPSPTPSPIRKTAPTPLYNKGGASSGNTNTSQPKKAKLGCEEWFINISLFILLIIIILAFFFGK